MYKCICGKSLSQREINYCKDFKKRFSGNCYCFDCQNNYKS